MYKLSSCRCGTEVQVTEKTTRLLLKSYSENLILAMLFGCKKCIDDFKIEIKKLRSIK